MMIVCDTDDGGRLKKNMKLIQKLSERYDIFIASEALICQIRCLHGMSKSA